MKNSERIESLNTAIMEIDLASGYLVSVARILSPGHLLLDCPAGIHAFELDYVCELLEEIMEDTE